MIGGRYYNNSQFSDIFKEDIEWKDIFKRKERKDMIRPFYNYHRGSFSEILKEVAQDKESEETDAWLADKTIVCGDTVIREPKGKKDVH